MDWSRVSDQYGQSTLDRQRLDRYSKAIAETLKVAHIPFHGTFSSYEGYYSTETVQVRNGVLRRLFGSGPLRQVEERTGLGYWTIDETHWGSLKSQASHSHRDYWILLEDGRLGRFLRNRHHDDTFSIRCDGNEMSDDDVLLLDRKHVIIEKGWDFFEGRKRNTRLTVSSKGAGCSRQLTELIKEHELSLPVAIRKLAIETELDSRIKQAADAIHENIFG